MAMFRNVMVYLGLGPDDEYDDGYYEDDDPNTRLGREMTRETMSPAVVTTPRPNSGYDDVAVPAALGGHPSGAARGGPSLRPGGLSAPEPDVDLSADPEVGGVGAVRPLRAVPDDHPGPDAEPLGTEPAPPMNAEPEPQGRPVVEDIPQPQRSKPVTVTPQGFGDAKHVADEFRIGVPVIMNLQGVDRDVARRLIDFASGICYCLDGAMEKVAPQVFLLTPESARVSDDDRRRIEERGYHR